MTGGFNTTTYKGYLLRISLAKNGFYGVRAWKNGKPVVIASGHHQYIGMAKTKREAIADAMHSIDGWNGE